ncbi:MAG: hypothetical protein PF693_09550 [Spirochaetia bacterium]|jgi:hypothetical protein|nr:hypothetical protein [Spirochaetia bacterium]
MRNSILFIFLILSLTAVYADTGIRVKDTVFIPKEYYVGDKVELRIKLDVESNYRLQLPSALPSSSWIDINSIEITDNNKVSELRIVFTSFIPGTRSFPTLFLGEVILNSVKIHTSSLIEIREGGFIGIEDQLLLPGTKLGLSIIVGILFIGPILIILLLGPFRRKIAKVLKNNIGRSPISKLNKLLRELDDQRTGISCRRFYIRLSAAVREYMSKRSDLDFITMTTSDIEIALIQVLGHREYSSMLTDMMKLSDTIKFGKVTTADKKKMDDIELIKNISKFLEEKIKSNDKSRSSV